jgi:hypothetical protein
MEAGRLIKSKNPHSPRGWLFEKIRSSHDALCSAARRPVAAHDGSGRPTETFLRAFRLGAIVLQREHSKRR